MSMHYDDPVLREVNPHGRYDIGVQGDPRNAKLVATCTCGWTSPALSSAGLAGASWDHHVDEVARLAAECF